MIIENINSKFEDIASFWQFIDELNWAPGANCKARLLKTLSPAQSSKYKKMLDYICTLYADMLSEQCNYHKVFDSKAYCSNIIGEKGYTGFVNLLEQDLQDHVSSIELQNIDLEDVFLFMIPEDDDYWY